jgi:anti-anti-sigma factor
MRIELIQPTGHLDATTTNYFREQVSEILDREPDALLIDLTYLKQMDSSGLGALIFALRSSHGSKCKFALCSISENISFLLEATSMQNLFQVFGNRQEFERSLRKV